MTAKSFLDDMRTHLAHAKHFHTAGKHRESCELTLKAIRAFDLAIAAMQDKTAP